MTLVFESGSKSVPGSEHPYEDRVLVDEARMLYAVADGVTLSSQGSGGAAAEVALKFLSEDFAGDMVEAVRLVHKRVVELRKKERMIGETTLTCASVSDDRCDVANVGDSPAYLVREGNIRSLIREDKSEFGYITQVIGYPERIEVHHVMVSLRAGDCLIVASDGVAHVLNPSVVTPLIKRGLGARQLAEGLVEEAGRRPAGYDDDKSVIVVKVR
jgi:PPM family protein phosphatase